MNLDTLGCLIKLAMENKDSEPEALRMHEVFITCEKRRRSIRS
jgi:hypothetical protein